MLEKFYGSKYDEDILFVNPCITFGEFKKHVYYQTKEFLKSPKGNVVLFGDDYFNFAVNFFAAVFARKNIYLLSDKTRLAQLDDEYILPEKSYPVDAIFQDENLDINEAKIYIFTSGSTGEPQLIQKNLAKLILEAQSIIDEFNLAGHLISASTVSLTHSFGFTFNFILPFWHNLKINCRRIEFPEQFGDIKDDYILISTPTFMEKLAKYDFVFEKAPEKIFLAGSKLKNNVLDYFKRFSDVIDIYGSTETGNIAFKRGYDEFRTFKDVSVSVDRNDNTVVTSGFFVQEKVILPDIIQYVNEKEFILKKRSDRIVKIFEKRVSLDEIENILKKHADVKDCYCFMYANKLACVAATDNFNLDKDELRHFLLQFSEVVPKKWRILSEIPLTANGRIDKTKLNRIFGMNLSLPFVLSKKVSSDNAEINLIFKKNCNFFDGHFDIMPILPGVVQLYYAKYFADNFFNIEIPPDEVKKVKFSNIIKSDTEITLKLKNKENCVDFTYEADDKVYSSGIFVK